MIKAIIDVGSNSVRMLIEKDGIPVSKSIKTTRLGADKKDDFLSEKSSLRTLNGISEFVEEAKKSGADGIFAFATAAVRNAANGKDFAKKVKSLCGIELDVLSGETEAKIGAFGALCGKDGGVIDIGGGSTEIAVIKGGAAIYSVSLPYGAVNLKDKFGQDAAAIKKFMDSEVKKYGDVPKTSFYAIGGTATSLAAISLNLSEYSSEKVNGYKFTKSEIDRVAADICAKTVEERKGYKSLQKERADIIHAGACILRAVTDYIGACEITVSESDNLEGYSMFLAGKL